MNQLFFKVRGVDRLLTLQQLEGIDNRFLHGKIKVVDLKSQRNWCTNYRTILQKFK